MLTGLCFTVKFDFDENSKQHYFIFDGPDTSAHLFRENSTLTLVFQSNSSYSRYQTSNLTNPFQFTWDGVRVNDKTMKLVKSVGNLTNFQFNGYTFLSPYLEISHEDFVEYITQETLVEYRDINYGIFVAIALAVGLIMKSDNIISRTLKLLSNTSESKPDENIYNDENIYVEMSATNDENIYVEMSAINASG